MNFQFIFLHIIPNLYNSLGVGTTQLYNLRKVYNHRRHGEFTLGNRKFHFQVKHHFPDKLTQEFLLVDLVNNLDTLAEDKQRVLRNVVKKAETMDVKKLANSVSLYGTVKTKKILAPIVSKHNMPTHRASKGLKYAR